MSDAMSLAMYTSLLSLTDYQVTSYRFDEEENAFYFNLAPQQVVLCPWCGRPSGRRQRRSWKKSIADLSISGKKVWLRIRRDQYECPHCGCFTPTCSMVAPGTWVTQRLLDYAVELIRHSDIAQVARLLDLPESSLGRWYYAQLQRQHVDQPCPDHQPMVALGIDELALKKRHRQYVAVIIDHTNSCVLEILERRDKAKVKACLERLQARGVLDHLEEVTCDMWEGYSNAAQETLGPKVKVSIDRFHVMKAFQDQMNKARRVLQKELSAEEAKALKGSRWWWVTNEENLDALSRKELRVLKRRFPRLATLHDQRECLRAIFENRRFTVESGRRQLERWIKQARQLGLQALDAFCGTLERWMEGIAQYFHRRTTNGRTEGFNRGLRTILWRACGMTNFAHFRLRVLHAFGPHRPNPTSMDKIQYQP